jgi:hypothetical protein
MLLLFTGEGLVLALFVEQFGEGETAREFEKREDVPEAKGKNPRGRWTCWGA